MTAQSTTERRTQGREGAPPYEPELEHAVIGCVLLRPELYEPVAAVIGAPDFYQLGPQAVFATIGTMRAGGDAVDPVTVAAKLDGSTSIGVADLLSWQARAPVSHHAVGYAEILAEASQQRRAGVLAYELAEAVRERNTAAILRLVGDAPDRIGYAKGRAALEWEPLGAALRGEEPEIIPDLLFRSDNTALLYPGRLHWIQAEPGRAKSWVALVCVLEQLTFGEHVVYLDYESNRADVGKRLRKLGLDAEVAEELLHYARPGAHTPAVAAQLAADIERWRPSVCVLDGVAKSLQRNGYSEDKADEVGVWVDRVCRPVTAQGVALVAVDHVTKNPESRGRYARGSGVKLAEVDGAAYSMKRLKALSHSQAGEYHLIIEKDKEGGVGPEGDVAAVLRMEEDPATHIISFSVEPARTEDKQPRGIRTARERVLGYLAERPAEGFSLRHFEQVIEGTASQIRGAVGMLVDEGEVDMVREGNRMVHRLHIASPQGEF